MMPRRGENIRKRKDGRWEGRYIKKYSLDGKAIYASIYGKTYKEIKSKISVINNISNSSFEPSSQRKRFEDVLYGWLNKNKIKIKKQTYAKYLYLIDTHIVPSLGKIEIGKLQTETINLFLLEKAEKGRLDGTGGLSPSYLQTIKFIIKSAILYSHCSGVDLHNITKIQNIKAIKKAEVLTLSQQKKLEEYIDEISDPRKIGIILSLYSGLRIGEVCGLNWKDIDLESKIIYVKHSVERIKNTNAKNNEPKTELVLGSVKTSSSCRSIPISSRLYQILHLYKQEDGFVLKGRTYEYMDPRSYQNFFHRCLTKCDLPQINYHVLRHTFATRCLEAGVDIKSLSELLGHSNTGITLNTYVHSSMELKRKQLEKLSSIYGQ